MSLELLVNEIIKPFIQEGVEDPGIFKAVFLAGGPGSGKTYVAGQLFGIPNNPLETYPLPLPGPPARNIAFNIPGSSTPSNKNGWIISSTNCIKLIFSILILV